MKWFRVYSEIKDDPKMLELDYDQRWLWLSLMAMASESDERGSICYTRTRGLSAALRFDEERLVESLSLFDELGMVDLSENRIVITNWDHRQYDKPSDAPEATRDRKRKSRARHADVTPCHATDTDTDTDTELETETEDASQPAGAREAAEILAAADWVGDDLAGAIKGVERSLELVPGFSARDAPLEAEKFLRWHSGPGRKKRKPPADWYRAWLNWAKKSVEIAAQQPQRNGNGNHDYDPTAIWLEWAEEKPDEQDDVWQGDGPVIDITATKGR